jgi:hypothetical protein
MSIRESFKKLCSPAFFYFVVSLITIFIIMLQNIGNTNTYNLGNFSCMVSSTIFIFMLKLVYVIFWTWILNLICKEGYTTLSWILVLFPLILFFILLGLLLIMSK